jgi:hypothetical protein
LAHPIGETGDGLHGQLSSLVFLSVSPIVSQRDTE